MLQLVCGLIGRGRVYLLYKLYNRRYLYMFMNRFCFIDWQSEGVLPFRTQTRAQTVIGHQRYPQQKAHGRIRGKCHRII